MWYNGGKKVPSLNVDTDNSAVSTLIWWRITVSFYSKSVPSFKISTLYSTFQVLSDMPDEGRKPANNHMPGDMVMNICVFLLHYTHINAKRKCRYAKLIERVSIAYLVSSELPESCPASSLLSRFHNKHMRHVQKNTRKNLLARHWE